MEGGQGSCAMKRKPPRWTESARLSHCCVRAEGQQGPLPLALACTRCLFPAERFSECLCARGRAAYVGVNTWDLMDKARYVYNRDEVSARLDAMVKAGWGVGRTWGFSLGDGLTNGIMGTTVADKNKILETGPGALFFSLFFFRALALRSRGLPPGTGLEAAGAETCNYGTVSGAQGPCGCCKHDASRPGALLWPGMRLLKGNFL